MGTCLLLLFLHCSTEVRHLITHLPNLPVFGRCSSIYVSVQVGLGFLGFELYYIPQSTRPYNYEFVEISSSENLVVQSEMTGVACT